MTNATDIGSAQAADLRRLGWAGGAALAVGYVVVFLLTTGLTPMRALTSAVANVAPLVALALATVRLHRTLLFGGGLRRRLLAHGAGAVAFSVAWYCGLVLSLAAVGWAEGGPFRVVLFRGPALPWQLFQGLTIYAAIAAFGLVPRTAPAPAPAEAPPLTRWLMRRGDEIVPVDAAEIICIRGADDYAEVATARGRRLARLSLQAFERRLPAGRFVRVHRSCIVNLDRLLSAEAAGDGRLTLHLEGGETVTTSRSGAQALRSRVL